MIRTLQPLAPVLLIAGGAWLWLCAMAGPGAHLAAFGPICGAHGLAAQPHCWRCFAALALAATGLALIAFRRTRGADSRAFHT